MKRAKLLISAMNAIEGQKTHIEIKDDEFEKSLITHRNLVFGSLYVLLLCLVYELINLLTKG